MKYKILDVLEAEPAVVIGAILTTLNVLLITIGPELRAGILAAVTALTTLAASVLVRSRVSPFPAPEKEASA